MTMVEDRPDTLAMQTHETERRGSTIRARNKLRRLIRPALPPVNRAHRPHDLRSIHVEMCIDGTTLLGRVMTKRLERQGGQRALHTIDERHTNWLGYKQHA